MYLWHVKAAYLWHIGLQSSYVLRLHTCNALGHMWHTGLQTYYALRLHTHNALRLRACGILRLCACDTSWLHTCDTGLHTYHALRLHTHNALLLWHIKATRLWHMATYL